MKNTALTTKKGLVEYLKENVVSVSEELAKQIEAVIKLGNKATLDELKELAQEVAVDLLTGGTSAPVVENEVKPKKKLGKKTSAPAPKEEVKEVPKEVKEEAKEEKPAKKTPAKKEEKAKEDKPKAEPKVKTAPTKSTKETELASSFPASLDTPLGKLELNLKSKDMKDLYSDYEKGVTNIFAVYWNKRQLKQFPYDPMKVNAKSPTSFPDDLDLVQPIYISEEGKILYAVSIYTEVIYTFFPNELEVDEDTNLRYVNGAEYSIYTVQE